MYAQQRCMSYSFAVPNNAQRKISVHDWPFFQGQLAVQPNILFHDTNCSNACQPRLGVWGASQSLPGRIGPSDLIRAGTRQMMNVRQDHIVPGFLGSTSYPVAPLPSCSEQVCLESSDLLHTHLALAGKRFNYCYYYY